MSRKFLAFCCILLILLLGGSLWINAIVTSRRMTALMQVIGAGDKPQFREQIYSGNANAKDKIALISIRGAISESEPGQMTESMLLDLIYALRQAKDDPDVKAVVLRIDSPGGEVTASDTLYRRVKELRMTKPVVVSMGAMAASGAYYAACGANYIVANESTSTGSIGVIISVLNYRDLFGKVGLQSLVFKSGAFKDIMSGSREMTKPEQDYMDMMVMQAFERFLSVVAEERKLSKVVLKEKVGDGRIMSGYDALAYKLVDQNGTLEDAITKAKDLAKITDPNVVLFIARKRLGDVFSGWLPVSRANMQLRVDVLPTPRLEPGKVYLIPELFAPAS